MQMFSVFLLATWCLGFACIFVTHFIINVIIRMLNFFSINYVPGDLSDDFCINSFDHHNWSHITSGLQKGCENCMYSLRSQSPKKQSVLCKFSQLIGEMPGFRCKRSVFRSHVFNHHWRTGKKKWQVFCGLRIRGSVVARWGSSPTI